MASAGWKVLPEPEPETAAQIIPNVRLDGSASRFFAVDLSGSTMGSILKNELAFVKTTTGDNASNRAVSWGSSCSSVTPVANISSQCLGGTSPEAILQNQSAVDAILTSNVWYLITDGEIFNVERLCGEALGTPGVLDVPIIFVIVGPKATTPAEVNISVGVSFFANASHALVVFKDTRSGKLYPLAGKGCFTSGMSQSIDLSSWDSAKPLNSDADFTEFCMAFEVPPTENRPQSRLGVVDLGEEFGAATGGARVDIDRLLQSAVDDDDLGRLLADDAFSNLALACKTRGKLPELRSFLQAHKTGVVTLRLEDVSGAADIVMRLSNLAIATPGGDGDDASTRKSLQNQLRAAHEKNRAHYAALLRERENSPQAQSVVNRNRRVDHALRELATFEQAGYTGEILSRRSNRARRAEAVGDGGDRVQVTQLDLDALAYRGPCQVCCSDDEVLCIGIRQAPDAERAGANTDNFALDFPLAAGHFALNDVICSHGMCFGCATALGSMSLYREPLAASLPTLAYTGVNRAYIQEQLYVALTGRLKVGGPIVSQLFMTILARTIREKQWADKELLGWMLRSMLENTPCRETFNEQGDWVSYPKALAWAAKDFAEQGVDSWVIGYPIAGFEQLLEFGAITGAFSGELAADMRLPKLMHLVASACLAKMLKNQNNPDEKEDGEWKRRMLSTVYTRLHAPTVPVDLRGQESIVSSTDTFWARLTSCLVAEDNNNPAGGATAQGQVAVARFLQGWSAEAKERAMSRIQLLAFWLAFSGLSHSRPKTFFAEIRLAQPLALRVLDVNAALPPSVIHPVLLSIFRGSAPSCTGDAAAFHALHTGTPLFATPYGPSVLQCCFARCAERFLGADAKLPPVEEKWTMRAVQDLRDARAKHLIKVFGTPDGRFDASETGMPMPTITPEAPSSTHVNMHAGIAKTWSELGRDTRRAVARGVAAGGGEDEEGAVALGEFVDAVRAWICEGGRGDIFNDQYDADVRCMMPSFLEVLRRALLLEQGERGAGEGEVKGELDVADYEYDWTKASVEDKAKLELKLGAMGLD